jgi:hypothetical protein
MTKQDALNQIEELKQFIEDCDKPKNKYVPFCENTEKNFGVILSGELRIELQVAVCSAPNELRGRCLILSNKYNWEIIKNPKENTGYDNILVCTRKD